MTREEIKEGLKFTIDMFKFDPLTGEERTLNKLDATTVNACEEAIKALEQEPTTKNDLAVDCVSRAYLYNRIKGIDHDEDYECDEFGGSRITYHTCDWDEVLKEIEDAPSVTPQKPSWVPVTERLPENAKRELIDRTRLLTENMKSKYYHLANGDIAIPIIDIEHSHTITEQEIVKPYLEKLKAEINEMDLNRIANEYEDRLYGFQSKVLQLIDNLLSESEGK